MIEAYCTGASLHQTTTGACVCFSLHAHDSSTDAAINHTFSLIYTFAGSGAERVRPSGASARGGEDHCGGDEKQRPDGYRREVSVCACRMETL